MMTKEIDHESIVDNQHWKMDNQLWETLLSGLDGHGLMVEIVSAQCFSAICMLHFQE